MLTATINTTLSLKFQRQKSRDYYPYLNIVLIFTEVWSLVPGVCCPSSVKVSHPVTDSVCRGRCVCQKVCIESKGSFLGWCKETKPSSWWASEMPPPFTRSDGAGVCLSLFCFVDEIDFKLCCRDLKEQLHLLNPLSTFSVCYIQSWQQQLVSNWTPRKCCPASEQNVRYTQNTLINAFSH